MMNLPVPLIGQAYTHRDVDLAAQTCINYWPEINTETDKILTLRPFWGLKAAATGSGQDGGMHTFDGVLYKVCGNTLYSETKAGVRTSIGTIAGSGLCSFDHTATEMIIVRDSNVYTYNGSTLTKATDTDFTTNNYVTVINNQAVYDNGGQEFIVSDAGDLTTLNSLNFAAKEGKGDDLVRPYAFNEIVYMFGEKHSEQWWNSGTGNPPLDRITGGSITKGTLSGNSIAHNENYLYFLGDDYCVYRLIGKQPQKISTVPLSQEFRTYSVVSDAIGACFSFDNQNFYYLKFPSGKTWCYCEASGGWFELTTTNLHTAYKPTSHAVAYGRNYFAINGNTYYLDKDTYTNDGETILRERISGTISARLINPAMEGLALEMSWLELVIKTGSVVTGQGSDPIVMFSFSDNGGRSWSNERQLKGQKAGNYMWRIRTEGLGMFYERIIRVRVSDPVSSAILGCTAQIEVGLS